MKKFIVSYKQAHPYWVIGLINPFTIIGSMLLFYIENKIPKCGGELHHTNLKYKYNG